MNNVRKIREKIGMTRQGLADKSGVSFSMIQKIETTTTGVSLENCIKIADALDADFNDVWIVK